LTRSQAITHTIFLAQAQCSRKAFLLARGEPGTPHEYVRSVERTATRVRKAFVEGLLRAHPSATVSPHLDVAHGADFVPAVRLVAGPVEAECDLLTRVPGRRQSRSQYEPTIVVGTHVVLDEHRARLMYIGYVLGSLQGRPPARGTIVTADQTTHRGPYIGQASADARPGVQRPSRSLRGDDQLLPEKRVLGDELGTGAGQIGR
jgi:hypothetical protein